MSKGIGIAKRLEKYATHESWCVYWNRGAKRTDWDNPAFCTCGLAALLGELYQAESAEVSQ